VIRVRHAGREWVIQEIDKDWLDLRSNASSVELAQMDRAAAEGLIIDARGHPMTGAPLKRMRARLGMVFDWRPNDVPAFMSNMVGLSSRQPSSAGRWLVPDLWRFGTIPFLGGPPKVGKTTMVADLAASLAIPGHRFLNHFEPADLTDAERHPRGIWLINAETSPEVVESDLVALGVISDHGLAVSHLEELGGPDLFDITDPATYERWANEFVACETCLGDDDAPPAVVIVDGLTAILQAAGKGVEAYGNWYAQFRRLMREIGTENALVVGHNTMSGEHLMGGVEAQAGADALWTYSMSHPDNPSSKRWFSTRPRRGGAVVPRTEVVFGADGRLKMGPAPSGTRNHSQEAQEAVLGTTGRTSANSGRDPQPETPEEVLDYVARCNSAGKGPSARDIRENVRGPNTLVDGAVRDLVESGSLIKSPRAGRGGGDSYWLQESGSVPSPS
jgi:AAA domain